ncbi:MAG: NAD+ synthase [Rhodospirillaceae bacterium]|nr:NAD+ synthase [Rhodospirillaceae bacterium]
MKITIAQLDPKVGDIDANLALIRKARNIAASSGTDLVVYSELVVSGYPPEDLVQKTSFYNACKKAVMDLAADTKDGGPAMLVSAPWADNGKLYNGALLLDGGKLSAVIAKCKLPNYGVFDEVRLFDAGSCPVATQFRGHKIGIMTCEDMWDGEATKSLKQSGAELLIVLNASPFEMDKPNYRKKLAAQRAKESGLALIYVNQVGGQDELVFDGASFAISSNGKLKSRLPAFVSSVETISFSTDGKIEPIETTINIDMNKDEAIYSALVMGLRDYVNKNFFPGVLIGLSGGVDSALSAAIAVDALGAERVHCVMMPSPYTSDESLEDAAETARLLGVRLDTISIKPAMDAFDEMTAQQFTQHPKDTTEENIQARARGVVLMAISNKFGYMVLSTGNKSEMSVGYATLYGDMCGGYSVLKDVYKTRVWELCRWRNSNHTDFFEGPNGLVMPERVITKAPSAELKPNQTDQDSLPPYEELDDILHSLIELELPSSEIIKHGHSAETVARVWKMLDNAEYKRRQAPPGVKISSRAFGRDRRYPITNGFRTDKF